jgi:peptidoglycan/xylan/chitin deacetylase (PgdA/CDA1 family)
VAYLTFDDGPSEWTDAILTTLAQEQVPATFFVNARGSLDDGRFARSFTDGAGHVISYREVLKRMVDEGHALGNHTRDHADLGSLTATQIADQFRENERAINDALVSAGAERRALTLLRAPYGSPWTTQESPGAARAEATVGRVMSGLGFNVLWNLDSTDSREWSVGEASSAQEEAELRLSGVPQEYADKVERLRSAVLDSELVRLGGGIVVLMHDTHNSTRDALPELIAGLKRQGYTFQTVDSHFRALPAAQAGR